MPFFWQRSATAVRHAADGDLAVEEKSVGEPPHAQRLTDEEAFIIHNLVELHLIDAGEEELFLRRKENQDGICFDERTEGKAPAADGCPVLRLVVRKPAGNVWSLSFHILAVLCAVMGRRFLNQAMDVLEAYKRGGFDGEDDLTKTFVRYDYDRFWGHGAPNVLPLLVVPMVWLGLQSLVRICRRSIAPMIASIYEITMIVLLIYFPTVPVALDGYKWQEVLDIFGGGLPVGRRIDKVDLLARQYELAGLLFVYPIAAVYLVLITTRMLTAIATLARGTASPGTLLYWLHRRGHSAASGLYLITAIFSAVGASMNIWNGMWYGWFRHDMEHITSTWKASGFPLQTLLLAIQVLAFLGVSICALAGDAPAGRTYRRFSAAMAVVLAYSVFTCTQGIIAMESDSNQWAAETTRPRHIVAVLMAALVSLIHTFIAFCPALTRQASVDVW